jgi:dinuclear metal center YbgI/SA1388 family protein
MTTLKEVVTFLNGKAPLAWQESYDNAGLLTGDPEKEVSSVLLTVDITEEVVAEAVSLGAELIVAHHPIIFKGLKKLTGGNYVERTVLAAVRHDIALYAGHTNFDAVEGGINTYLAEKLSLKNIRILSPKKGLLRKLVTFVPQEHAAAVREALWSAGAGTIGNYDQTSFSVAGEGTFRGNEETRPFAGIPGKLHHEKEIRLEVILPSVAEEEAVRALLEAHPYEEPAWDIFPLENAYPKVGAGAVGELETPAEERAFLQQLKATFDARCVRHTPLRGKPVRRVAVCGGTGSFLLKEAIRQDADMFVTADFKYHEFFDAEGKIVVADIGHYESEQVAKELFYDLLSKKFPNFALHFSKSVTNPINYF